MAEIMLVLACANCLPVVMQHIIQGYVHSDTSTTLLKEVITDLALGRRLMIVYSRHLLDHNSMRRAGEQWHFRPNRHMLPQHCCSLLQQQLMSRMLVDDDDCLTCMIC
jgi:hypothetical protein